MSKSSESAPNTPELTIEQIDAEIARIDKRIIEIESQPAAFMEQPHFETGSDSDDGDRSLEFAMDAQAMANGPELILERLHHRKTELEALKASRKS